MINVINNNADRTVEFISLNRCDTFRLRHSSKHIYIKLNDGQAICFGDGYSTPRIDNIRLNSPVRQVDIKILYNDRTWK